MTDLLRMDETSEGLLEVNLQGSSAAHAIDLPLATALAELGRRCEASKTIRAVILTAEGALFSAGGNVKSFAKLAAGEGGEGALPAALRELTLHLHAAMSAFARMPAVLITAVNGVAAGAGISLAMSGDLVLAAESATFTMAYTAIGLSPDGGSTYWLPRLVGMRRAQELILTNRKLSAREAQQWGLVTEVVADADLPTRARSLGKSLASGPTGAFGASKRLLLASSRATYEEQLDLEARSIAELSGHHDAREGLASFSAKRAPLFRGS